MSNRTAVVFCPSGADLNRQLLGLDIGERLLLSLSYGGIKRIAFVGDGPRPVSDRAEYAEIDLSDIRRRERVLLLPSDLVLDRKAFCKPADIAPALPLRWVRGEQLEHLLSDPSSLMQTGDTNSTSGFAIRVTDRASAKQAEKVLLNSLRKPIDGLVSRHLNRHVSLFFTKYLVKIGWRPNTFTVIFMLLGLLAAAMVGFAEYWWALVLGGVLFQAQSILDGCDGEMARLTYRFSEVGQWMDSIGDDVTNYFFMLGLTIGLFRVSGEALILYSGLLAFTAQWLSSGICYRRMAILGTGDLLAIPDTVSTKDDGSLGSRIIKSLRVLTKRDVFVFIIASLVALQAPLVAFVLYAGFSFPMLYFIVMNDLRVARITAPAPAQLRPAPAKPAENLAQAA